MPTSEYWRNYRREYRRKQQLQRQQLEGKDAQFIVDLGALQRDASDFRQKYNTKRRDLSMPDMVTIGGEETGALHHGMMHEQHRRDLQDHLREGHVSLEEHMKLQARVDALETALNAALETIDEMYNELYPDKDGEE